jgi:hypothetical protein
VLLCAGWGSAFLFPAALLHPATKEAFRRPRRLGLIAEHRCPECQYGLIGNVSGICPECGRPVPAGIEG